VSGGEREFPMINGGAAVIGTSEKGTDFLGVVPLWTGVRYKFCKGKEKGEGGREKGYGSIWGRESVN